MTVMTSPLLLRLMVGVLGMIATAAPTRAAAAAAAPARAAPAATPSTRPTIDEKCRRLAARWRERFEAERMTCIVSPPFVVAGDGGRARVTRYVDHTIRAADAALERKFFDRARPDEPVLILLFESRGPYARLAKKWFDHGDVPHYGFYRRRENVMLMNVGTGTGTLVHELVHALIASDFPDVPSWFNEGLGSLYEQCSIGRDHQTIAGHANWRLPALKAAIRKDELRSLRELIEDENFYDAAHVGMNYAQARYLLMYLQEKKLLTDYYARFRDNAADDPTGLKTLEAVVAPKSLAEFEKQWRAWVLTLHFS